jgi:endonuclease-3
MSSSNRASKLTKTHKVLKKHYKPHSLADRPVLEHLLYACCLEFAPPEAADESFAKLQQTYYDWNEVRVTTISELSEVLSGLPRAAEAASRLKRSLQSVFECYYSFDLEPLKKENIGKAVKQLEGLDGISKFVVAFVTQNGLGGHAIAVNDDGLETLRVLGVVSDDEAKKQRVPGLERAISKSKGVEFGSLLHQLATDYGAAPFSPRVRAIMLEIAPDAKERFPKRGTRKKAKETTGEPQTKSRSKNQKKGTAPKKKGAMNKKSSSKSRKKKSAEPKKKSSSKRLAKKKPR